MLAMSALVIEGEVRLSGKIVSKDEVVGLLRVKGP